MALPEATIRTLLRPYLGECEPISGLFARIDRYLDLILLWNGRTNLMAVREPEAIVQRQIGESLFAARSVPDAGSLLDFGSGAGLPGIPIALMKPGLTVTLAESQGKKASFLREACRSLELPAAVWASRVEMLPATRRFDCVTMRAVDDSARMLPLGLERIGAGGTLVRFLGEGVPEEISGWREESLSAVPNSRGMLQVLRRG